MQQSWRATVTGAHTVGQLGGAAKAVEIARGFWSLATSQPLVLVAALAIYLVYRRWPRVGRVLLAGVPIVLWMAAQHIFLEAAGYVEMYVFLAPYLFLFIPHSRRVAGATLLIWVWAAAVVAGVMTAYTSAVGYVNAVVGLAPALMVSGVFLAWALEAVGEKSPPKIADGRRAGSRWLALVVLIAIVGVTVALQFEYQQHDVPYSELTSRIDSGPWWGIRVTPERRTQVESLAEGLRSVARPGDKLLIMYVAPGYYLLWNGPVVSYSYWMGSGPDGGLPAEEVAYLRQNKVAPSLVVRLMPTAGLTPAEIAAGSDGFAYPAVLVRPGYVIYRKPAGESTSTILSRLRQP